MRKQGLLRGRHSGKMATAGAFFRYLESSLEISHIFHQVLSFLVLLALSNLSCDVAIASSRLQSPKKKSQDAARAGWQGFLLLNLGKSTKLMSTVANLTMPQCGSRKQLSARSCGPCDQSCATCNSSASHMAGSD